MRINRTQNAARNIVFGLVERIIALAFPFMSRTVFIYCLGVDFLGLNGLFTSIISVLSLTELGIGSAMVYHMYQAIASDDNETMCALLNFYKKCYTVIGIAILIIGLLVSPWISYLIEGNIPSGINIYILFGINIINTALSYLLFAYKNSILAAFQRNDILSKINTVLNILQNIFQITVLLAFRNYYLYCMVAVVLTGARNIVNARCADKMYPQYRARGEMSNALKNDIKSKVSALFVNRVGNVVANSVDTIVISAFLGLAVSAIYGNYLYIITMLTGFLQIYYSSISAGIGNSISIETIDKNYNDFKRLVFMQYWIAGWCSICLLSLYQPFIELWVGEELMLPNGMVLCLAVYFFFWKTQDIVYVYKEAAGLWQQDKYCTIIGTIFNLILNIVLVQYIGLYGIVLSTICMNVFIMIPWRTQVVYKFYFKKSVIPYYIELFGYMVAFVIAAGITYKLCRLVNGSVLKQLIIRAVLCISVPNLFYWAVYRRLSIYKETKIFLINKVGMLKFHN